LVAQIRKMRRKNFEKLHDRFVLALRKNSRAKESFLHFIFRVLNSPGASEFHDFSELRFGRFLFENLAGMEETDKLFPKAHRNSGVAHADLAHLGAGCFAGILGKRLLNLQTSGAGAALAGHHGAEWIFFPLAMMRQLPRIDRPQSQRETSGFAEGAFIVVVELRFSEAFNQGHFTFHIVGNSCFDERNIGRIAPANNWAVPNSQSGPDGSQSKEIP
jgi:hypothetical protein